jgi:hypothetical protein
MMIHIVPAGLEKPEAIGGKPAAGANFLCSIRKESSTTEIYYDDRLEAKSSERSLVSGLRRIVKTRCDGATFRLISKSD